jgi:hypothetical protein
MGVRGWLRGSCRGLFGQAIGGAHKGGLFGVLGVDHVHHSTVEDHHGAVAGEADFGKLGGVEQNRSALVG